MHLTWEIAEVVGTDEEAELIAGFLAGAEIPCEIESLRFHQEPVNFGSLGEVRVLVPSERLAEAQQVLAERRSAIGAPDDEVAPA